PTASLAGPRPNPTPRHTSKASTTTAHKTSGCVSLRNAIDLHWRNEIHRLSVSGTASHTKSTANQKHNTTLSTRVTKTFPTAWKRCRIGPLRPNHRMATAY
ncbi:unnamed protein product, partial [Ectocarpus sp. 12 AP-2014]